VRHVHPICLFSSSSVVGIVIDIRFSRTSDDFLAQLRLLDL